jgi:hypothetical protein
VRSLELGARPPVRASVAAVIGGLALPWRAASRHAGAASRPRGAALRAASVCTSSVGEGAGAADASSDSSTPPRLVRRRPPHLVLCLCAAFAHAKVGRTGKVCSARLDALAVSSGMRTRAAARTAAIAARASRRCVRMGRREVRIAQWALRRRACIAEACANDLDRCMRAPR